MNRGHQHKGLYHICPKTGKDVLRLVLSNVAMKSGAKGNRICLAMDAVFKVIPTSTDRGGKIRIEKSSKINYVCFEPKAAHGHAWISLHQ